MNVTKTLVFLTLLIVGCAPSTRVSSLGGYRYMVSAHGMGWHDRADLIEAAHREAARVCNGWRYDIVDRADGGRSSYRENSYGGVSESQKLDSTIVFECIPPGGAAR